MMDKRALADRPSIYLAIFLVLAFIKTPRILLEPRFWAEEGRSFFEPFLDASLPAALLHLHLGTLHLPTNIAIYIATLVPIEFAPTVTTYVALAANLVVALQLLIFARDCHLSPRVGITLLIAWTFLPNYEVWLNATNLQWTGGISMLLVLVLSTSAIERHRHVYMSCAAICGLSGVSGTLLAPAFLVRAYVERRRPVIVIAAVLTLCALLQLCLVATYMPSGRQFQANATIVFLPGLLQAVLSPLFSADFATGIGTAVKVYYPKISAVTIGAAGAALFTMAWVLSAAMTTPFKNRALLLFGTSIFVTLVQTLGALYVEPTDLLSGWIGGRYFYLGATSLCLFLAVGTRSHERHLRLSAGGMLILVCVVGITQRYTSAWPQLFLNGPSWRAQLAACAQASPCRVLTWPAGSPWYVDIVR